MSAPVVVSNGRPTGVQIRDLRDSAITARDIVGGDKISYKAIGAGAQVIINQARSPAAELDEARRLAAAHLSAAIVSLVEGYTGLAERPSLPAGRNPYRPLQPFELEDAPLFNGRLDALKSLQAALRADRLTVLHGDSGVGKSSLLQAGLAARLLADGQLPLVLRPNDRSPSEVIKAAFLPDIAARPELQPLADGSLRGFLTAVSGQLGDRTLTIILDQFESFLLGASPEKQRAFAVELADCLDDPTLAVRWVLAVRRAHLAALNVLQPYVAEPLANTVWLEPLTRAEAGGSLRGPARQRGFVLEEGLDGRLLDDLGGDAIDPSQLQLVGGALVEQLSGDERRLTLADYEALGGAAGILRHYLDNALARHLTAVDRTIAWRLLAAVAEAPAGGLPKTALAGVAASYDLSAAEVGRVAAWLEGRRLLRLSEETIRLANSSLLPRINQWAADRAARELARQEVARQLERVRASALRGALGGAAGFCLAFLIAYAGQTQNRALLHYLTLLRALPGAFAGLMLTLLVDVALASYRGRRRRWRWLAGALAGAAAFALMLLFHTLLRQQADGWRLALVAAEGASWGLVSGLGAVWLLTSRRPLWQMVPPLLLAGGAALWLGEQVGDAFELATDSSVMLAGAILPTAVLAAMLLARPPMGRREI